MATRSRTTFKKRQKEIARMEKQRDKAARRMQRRLDKKEPGESGATISDESTEPDQQTEFPSAPSGTGG